MSAVFFLLLLCVQQLNCRSGCGVHVKHLPWPARYDEFAIFYLFDAVHFVANGCQFAKGIIFFETEQGALNKQQPLKVFYAFGQGAHLQGDLFLLAKRRGGG